MSVITALDAIGIRAHKTRANIFVPDTPHVPVSQQSLLVPLARQMNKQLEAEGLLGMWRARIGGTTTNRWILVVRKKK